ncbi:MAG: NUDIX domain-containing protein [Firmicutes bacterium]|nr:NUDIX domain-containing protein [Bacillota bacterium]
MKLLKEIYESTVGKIKEDSLVQEKKYKVRKSARAVLFNKTGQIALLNVTKKNYHKLPGGGLEGQESILQALDRELIEEVGVGIEGESEVGLIVEYRDEINVLQFSYCYYGSIAGEIGKTSYSDSELKDGFELIWVDLNTAIEKMKKDIPSDYFGRFIQFRDLLILNETNEILRKK